MALCKKGRSRRVRRCPKTVEKNLNSSTKINISGISILFPSLIFRVILSLLDVVNQAHSSEIMLTPHQAKYYAYELTKRCPSDSVEKFSATLLDAQVDLNPHQVEAALFAFKSPLSNGAILADEVGLGKTIEAGLVISQKWAERKRRILIITPANLRKQWSQELQDKFFLPSIILESQSFKLLEKESQRSPFDRHEIVICSFQFARSKELDVRRINWDLVVIDEAHRIASVMFTSHPIKLRTRLKALWKTGLKFS